jgi:hypothetical protein
MNKRFSSPTKLEPESPDVLSAVIWIMCGLLIVIAILPLLARR